MNGCLYPSQVPVGMIDIQKLILLQEVFTLQKNRTVLLERVKYSVHGDNKQPNVSGITPQSIWTHPVTPTNQTNLNENFFHLVEHMALDLLKLKGMDAPQS